MKRYTELRHSEEGLASISLQNSEFCITLGRALGMDATHQVRSSSQLGCMEDELFASHLAARWTPPTRCKAVGGVDLQMGSSISIPVGQDCRFMLQVWE